MLHSKIRFYIISKKDILFLESNGYKPSKNAYNSCEKWRVSHDRACTIQQAFPFSHIYI